jgi:hypothetical protein
VTKWFNGYQEVKGIVYKNGYKSELNIEKLNELVKGHPEFMEKVNEQLEKDYFRNITVFESKNSEGEKSISVVFDNGAYISLLSCHTNWKEKKRPFVVELQHNKMFVSMMGQLI